MKKPINKNLLIIAGTAAAALLLLAAVWLGGRNAVPAGMIRIYLHGEVYAEEPLGIKKDVVIRQEDGETNVIRLTGDGFFMASSTCKNQQCVQQGTVTTENYTRRALRNRVICLPHEIQIELVLNDQQQPIDAPDI